MVTVAHIVRKIIKKKPYIEEALSRGLINNAALAEELMPQVEEELGESVKFSSVNMAIRRFEESLDERYADTAEFKGDSDITMRSNLIEVTIYKVDDVQKYVRELYDIMNFRSGDFLTVTHGMHEVMIITNEKHKKQILRILPENMVKKKIDRLSSLTINLPEEAVKTPGFFYMVTRALNWEGINITDIVSTYTEMTLILNEKDAAKAFNILRAMIRSN